MKNTFHIAKLSLFNMRLLSEIEDASRWHHDIGALKSTCCHKNSINEPVSLLHQGAFLSHAYICLVWLLEAVKKDKVGLYEKYEASLIKRFDFDQISKISGPRDVSPKKEKIRLIRNAISHARVVFDDSDIKFSDRNQKKEKEDTILSLSWHALGILADASLFSVNDQIYKRPNQAPEPTPVLGAPRAFARVAPSTGAAHL